MVLSGFFSSSETALFSLSNVQLEQMRRDEHPRLRLIERMLSEPRRLIITILIGNELVNVSASVISAAIVIELLGPDKKWINLLIMVPVLLLVGEITPKTLAIQNNVSFAAFEARPIEFFARIITPLRWVVRIVADGIITLIVGKERSQGNIITQDMVRTLAREAVGEGALDRQEAQFIDHIFEFGHKSVEDVMTPRSDIVFLPVDMSLDAMVEQLRGTWRTRVPVYRDNRDTIVGILHARDLLGVDIAQLSDAKDGVQRLVREAYFVPESKPVSELFYVFRSRKLSVALVVDEYGGVTGLVTMEDLLECIFGDIRSPSDAPRELQVEDLGNGRCAVDGYMSVEEFDRQTGSSLSTDQAETLGGLLLHEYGELPAEDTMLEVRGFMFRIEEVADNRIKRLSWERVAATESEKTMPPDSARIPTTEASREPDNDAGTPTRSSQE
jgi:CBS domain containing-hemolysin-like protein